MIAIICIWVVIILGAAITLPFIIIYNLSTLWMAYFFPALVWYKD